MKARLHSTGELRATSRYISQDRSVSMRGSIERALVELITNCDDSYRDLEDNGAAAPGKIRIEVERHRGRPSIISVKDRAAGMSAGQMETRLTHLGERTSGFEKGLSRRGLLGRGAKDVVEFGAVMFESIRDGEYARCCIERSNRYQIFCGRADNEVRKKLGINRGNGTVVTMRVEPRFSVPQHSTMVERFPRYFSLRDIMSNPRREVTLVEVRSRDSREDRLIYRYPSLPTLVDRELRVPGYAVPAHLTIIRHPEPFDEEKHGSSKPYRNGGILVKSAATIHDVTLFSFENDPYARNLSGTLQCNYIDHLVREYDELEARDPGNPAHPDSNPFRILRPDRDGLVPDHPFTRALYRLAEGPLKELIDAERKRASAAARSVETRELRRKLDEVGRMAARYLEEKLRELEEEPPQKPSTELPVGLTIIPPNEYPVPVNSTKTFSVYVKSASPLTAGSVLRISSDSDGIGVVREEVPLIVDEEDPCLGRSAFQVHGAKLGAEGFVSASLNGYQNVVLIEVIEPSEEDEEELPEGLAFERSAYRLVLSKPRVVRLRLSPVPLDAPEVTPILSCDCGDIAVSGRLRPLRRPRGCAYLETSISLLGRQLHATGILTATVGDLCARTRLTVVPQAHRDDAIEFRPVDRDFGTQRAVWSRENPVLLEIGARHPSVRPYLGPQEDDYPGRDSREYRVILAEIIAEAVAQRVLEAKADRWGQDDSIAVDQFYAEHGRYVREFLPRVQRVVAPPELDTDHV